jgi:hypothetical protein
MIDTRDVLEAIGQDPELHAAYESNTEFRNLMTHVTQATNGIKAIQILCRGYLELADEVPNVCGAPLSLDPADKPEPNDPLHP